jgi:hypothetical protein
VAPIPPEAIEALYSNGAFPRLQRALTSLSNLTSLALFDALVLAVLGWWLVALAVDFLGRRGRAVFRIMIRTVVMAAVVYLLFLVAWGFNYRRVPLTRKIPFDRGAITADAARETASRAVDELNDLHAAAHAELARTDLAAGPGLREAFARAQREVGVTRLALAARPKRSLLLDPYFRAATVEGMTDPFLHETLVAGGLLPFERPFVVAHEWSHLAGFADEAEANFVGWLTCMRGSDAARYSGWLFLYREIAFSLTPGDRSAVAGGLRVEPRDDLRAIAERVSREEAPLLSQASWRLYDAYLKANRVEAGTASYALVVQLILGSGIVNRVP